MQDIMLDDEEREENIEKFALFLEENQLPSLLEVCGFLAAIASGPNEIEPAEWMDFLGVNEDALMADIAMSIYSDICLQLEKQKFEVFNAGADCSNEDLILSKAIWACGYMLGMSLDMDAWLVNKEIAALLMPISNFNLSDEQFDALIEDNNIDSIPKHIRKIGVSQLSKSANEIYQYWQKHSN